MIPQTQAPPQDRAAQLLQDWTATPSQFKRVRKLAAMDEESFRLLVGEMDKQNKRKAP